MYDAWWWICKRADLSSHFSLFAFFFPFPFFFLGWVFEFSKGADQRGERCTILTNNRGISIYWLAADAIKDPLVFAVYLFSNQVALYTFWRFYSRWIFRARAGTSGYWKVRVRSRDVLPLRRVSRSFPCMQLKDTLDRAPRASPGKLLVPMTSFVSMQRTGHLDWWCHGWNSFFLLFWQSRSQKIREPLVPLQTRVSG